jgi:hypothetical protein
MKLVFVQNGMERSDEIDEWIALLHEEETSKAAEPLAEWEQELLASAAIESAPTEPGPVADESVTVEVTEG